MQAGVATGSSFETNTVDSKQQAALNNQEAGVAKRTVTSESKSSMTDTTKVSAKGKTPSYIRPCN